MTLWRLWRLVLVATGRKRITPGLWERPGPRDLRVVEEIGDTGGGWYRPVHRQQDPAVDPREPGGGESSAAGNDHGWSGCTQTAGAVVLDFHTLGRLAKWGGDLRHRQGDLSGGTDLYDLQEAWASYGEDLQIRSGKGWDALVADRAGGRWLVVQGQGNVPGSETFDGGHACALGPESNADGKWLFSDPLASGHQWVNPDAVRDWMRAWSSGYAWARSAAHPPSTPPPPKPPPPAEPVPPDRYPIGYQDGYAVGILDGDARTADLVFGSWRPGTPWPPDLAGPSWGIAPWDGASWVLPWPYPLVALLRNATPAAWGTAGWTAATWRTPADPGPGPGPELPPTGEWDLDSWPVSWAG